MSFREALERARHQVSLQKTASVKTETESNINTQVKEEVSTEANVVTHIPTIGQAIIVIAKSGQYAARKLKATGKCKRIAKRLVSGTIEAESFSKALMLIEKTNKAHADYKLLGGDATLQLLQHLKKGVTLDIAIQQPFKQGFSNEEK